ncbi:MAG: hypothetical protein HFJ38_05000 [Bacilli bacterium]|nr:hypothetical protein [Bacilli bacterium]
MENKKEEKEVIVYNIPGVIIPEQMTDNGIIKGENNLNQTPQPIKNTKEENKTPPNPSQVVSHNNQTITNSISNQTPIPQTNNIPINQVMTPTKERAQNITQIPNNNNLQPPSPPINQKKIEETPSKNKVIPLLIGIIVMLMGTISYFIYKDFITPKEEIDPVKELQRKRTINLNSLLVQKLYNYVNLDSCKDQINFFYGESNNITAKDLSNETKNYLAYRQLLNKDIKKENCSNYGKALHKNDTTHQWYCGEEYLHSKTNNFNDETSLTNRIDNEVLKKQVEAIFGPASYKEENFTVNPSLRYLYDNKASSYILQTTNGKNICKEYTNKLEKAFRKGDDITIVVKVTNKENKRMQMFNYTFIESEDGNYYFKALNKEDI